jgi:hypothetical protein
MQSSPPAFERQSAQGKAVVTSIGGLKLSVAICRNAALRLESGSTPSDVEFPYRIVRFRDPVLNGPTANN